MSDKAKELAGRLREAVEHSRRGRSFSHDEETLLAIAGELTRLAEENERLRGIKPDLGPRPPDGEGLPRYGIRWNGPREPLAVPMDDGYWTPWHLAARLAEAEQVLRAMLRCPGVDTTDQVTGETYGALIRAALGAKDKGE